jgi:excisionase family DNA binding protein
MTPVERLVVKLPDAKQAGTEPVEVVAPKELAPLVVDLATAAKLVGVSDRHLRKFLCEIPHVRIGGRLLFRVATLNEWLAGRETTETATAK